jgi:8-oxo-dGTP pyrophosphatase MutT (NUDIX family)
MGPSWEEVARLRVAFNRGQAVSQPQLDELCGQWIGWADPKGQETESLVLVDGLGHRLEPVRQAPRWLCHLLALRHRAVHVLLSWDSPRLGQVFVCQVRSWTKRDYPGFIDISVGGHVVGLADPRQSALAEMQEEMGVVLGDLVAGELTLIGGYDCTHQADDRPFYDAEWRDVYMARISSLACLGFTDGEVVGVYLCPASEARRLLSQRQIPVANGLRLSLPVCLEYLGGR